MMVHPTGFAALEVAVHIEERHILAALVAADPASFPSEVVAAFPSYPSEAEAAFPRGLRLYCAGLDSTQ